MIFKTPSIKARLTLFFAAAIFVLLTILALLFYWFTINIFTKADYEYISDEIDTIQYITESKHYNHSALKQAVIIAPQQDTGAVYNYYVRVFDQNKKVIMETPGMSDVLAAEKYFNSAPELIGDKRYYSYSINQNDYLIAQAPLNIGNHTNGMVQVALNITKQHHVIRDKEKIVYLLLLGTLISLVIGFLIAHRGMRSLYLLTDTVEKITAHSLSQRIDSESWPKELSGIGNAFNQMLNRIETSFEKLKQFSADLAHEMRAPITNLIGETEMSLVYADNVTEHRRVMESNLEELQRVASLIENILFLARAENPKLDLHKIRIDAHNEILHVCEFYQALMDEKNIQYTIQGGAELNANAVMFKRVISNLLSNAIKHTDQNGTISFDIIENDTQVEITVTDNGCGIAAEHLPKIFDRFYLVESSRSQGGTGLGLAIVKSIIELHHGVISMISEVDVGTQLRFVLPKE